MLKMRTFVLTGFLGGTAHVSLVLSAAPHAPPRAMAVVSTAQVPSSEVRRAPTLWESYRWFIIGTSAVVTAQLVLIVALMTQRARRRRAEETIRRRDATIRSTYERSRKLAGRLINAQEMARADIAQDLHDDICQRLVYVALRLNDLKSASGGIQDESTQKVLSDLENDTQAAFDGIRRLSHDLHPITLRVVGFLPALRAHCDEVEKRHDVQVTLTTEGDFSDVHPDVAVNFFRIAQESLRNAIEHGDAKLCTVRVARLGAYLELTVADDGRGFDLASARQDGKGLGLVTMEERSRAIGAHIQIAAEAGRGTTVYVRGPVQLVESPAAGRGQRARSSSVRKVV